jgi:antitoxin MazE
MRLKLRKTGNSLATIWPKEVLSRFNLKEGDQLYVVDTQHGVLVTPYDPKFEKTMENTDKVIGRFKNAYKELSKR